MPGSKKAHRNPTRLQPRRATRDVGKKGLPEAEDNSTLLPPTGGGVHKATGPVGIAHERKPRGPAARKLKKMQQALIKKVDARDPQEALAEQSRLLGLSVAPSPTSTKSAKTPKPAQASKGQGRRASKGEKRYMDDIFGLDDDPNDELQRAKIWIPSIEHRRRIALKPPGVNHLLWMSYNYLDEYIFQYSLSPAEVEALPLREDVERYEDTDGTPKPITPPGFQWDKNRRLVPEHKE